jgi:short-subunit dehydrogenase involved in D-alanine esterification of teichoic acids
MSPTPCPINVVINNAGIPRRVAPAADGAPWAEHQAEIDILLSGAIHLDHLPILIIPAHSIGRGLCHGPARNGDGA